jgi:RNA polymerase sigma-70 factor (ECF subfamily)
MALDRDAQIRVLLGRRAAVLGYILAIVRDPHLAEDVFQNVGVVALSKPGAFENEAAFLGWVYQTARFESLAAARKRSRAPCPLGEGALDLLHDAWVEESRRGDEDVLDALRACLRRLTPRARRLIDLKYGQEASGRRIADSLERPINTVYVALSRIHRALAACVQQRMAQKEVLGG